MKKIFLILMLISSEGWADTKCQSMIIEVSNYPYKKKLLRCDFGSEICYLKGQKEYALSCFKK